jgi:hypothetical protein
MFEVFVCFEKNEVETLRLLQIVCGTYYIINEK